MLKRTVTASSARKELYQAKLLFYLFLASLAMFFVGSLITYLVVREQAFHPHPDALPGTPMTQGPDAYRDLSIPISFWISTALLLVVSYCLQQAVWSIHRQKIDRFQYMLQWSMVGATIFVLIQSLGMSTLLQEHFTVIDGSSKVYGMSFTLAFIHALHVIGGMVFIGYIMYQANRNRYDHERHWAVDHCASYWHFLDVVWACMLVTFLITG